MYMDITYIGHSCFLFITSDGTRIVTDPFHSTIGVKMPKLPADIITISHDHYDHNNIEKIQGAFCHYNSPGDYQYKNIALHGLASFHDNVGGEKRGSNTIFIYEADGLRLCHLGDLGHLPSTELVEKIGHVDALFIPVGEIFTFDVKDAVKTIQMIQPEIVIPMHYKTEKLTLGLKTELKFLKQAGGGKRLGIDTISIDKGNMAQNQGIIVMESQA